MARQTPTVSVALERWQQLRVEHEIAGQTRGNEHSLVSRFAECVRDIQVGHVTPEHVRSFFTDLRANHRARVVTGKPMMPTSFNKNRLHLINFFGYCQAEGWVRRDDLMKWVKKLNEPPDADKLRLDRQQLLGLVDRPALMRDKAVIAYAANTSLRASEVVWPRLRHVDLDSGRLDAWLQKTREFDEMAISPHLRDYLLAWLSDYEHRCGPLQPDWYLFPARVPVKTGDYVEYNPGKPLKRAWDVVKVALAAQGYDDLRGQGVHTIRRSVARIAFDDWSADGSKYDSALRMVQMLLHHKQISTTEKYLGLNPDKHRRNQAMRAGFIFGAASWKPSDGGLIRSLNVR